MSYARFKPLIERLRKFTCGGEVYWCDSERFERENNETGSPGGALNRFGYFVVATTIGGNALAIKDATGPIFFAGHNWYFDDQISYEDLSNPGTWKDLPLTESNLLQSLHEIAENSEHFIAMDTAGSLELFFQSNG